MYEMADASFSLRASFAINGRISQVKCLRSHSKAIDYIVFLLESQHLVVVSWQDEHPAVLCNIEARDIACRPVEHGPKLVVDPDSRFVVMHMSQGLLKVVSVRWVNDKPHFSKPFNVCIDELCISDIQFLPKSSADVSQPSASKKRTRIEEKTAAIISDATIGVLYADSIEGRSAKAYILNRDNNEPVTENTNVVFRRPLPDLLQRWNFSLMDPTSHLLIPVPAPRLGVVCVGYTLIQYYSLKGKVDKCVYGRTRSAFVCWTQVDDDGYRYLLGDADGSLYVLILAGNPVESLHLEPLGAISIPTALCYFGKGNVFVASHMSNSQLICLESERQPTGNFFNILDCLSNIGPILDAVVLDDVSVGEGSLVACAGSFEDSAIKIMKPGIGAFVEQAIEATGMGVVSIFAVNQQLLASTPFDSFALEFSGAEARIHSSAPKSLLAVNSVARVYRDSVIFGEQELAMNVTMAAASGSQVAVIATRELVLISAASRRSHTLPAEPSSLDFVGEFAIVGLFTLPSSYFDSSSTAITEIPSNSPITSIGKAGDFLLVGTADGILFYKSATQSGSVVLGTHAIYLRSLSRDAVLLRSNDIRIATTANGLLSFRMVNFSNRLTEATDAVLDTAVLDSTSFVVLRKNRIEWCRIPEEPASIAAALSTKLHIQSLPVRALLSPSDGFPFTARRIARHAQSQTLAVLASNYPGPGPVGRYRVCTPVSQLLLLNEQTLEVKGSFCISEVEATKRKRLSALSITSSTPPSSNGIELIFVGCVFLDVMTPLEDEDPSGFIPKDNVIIETVEQPSGRTATAKPAIRRRPYVQQSSTEAGFILAFSYTGSILKLLSSTKVEAAPFSMQPFSAFIAAGIGSQVSLFTWSTAGSKDGQLVVHASTSCQVTSVGLATSADLIAVGDIMRSVSVLEYQPKQMDKHRLLFKARDPAYHWISSVAMSGSSVLASDNCGNLLSYELTDGSDLKRIAAWHLGEVINTLVPHRNTLKYLTNYGSVGTIRRLTVSQYRLLKRVEQKANQYLPHHSLDQPYSTWRAFRDGRQIITMDAGDNGAVDGEVLRTFQTLDARTRQGVIEGLQDNESGSVVSLSQVDELVKTLLPV